MGVADTLGNDGAKNVAASIATMATVVSFMLLDSVTPQYGHKVKTPGLTNLNYSVSLELLAHGY